MNKETRKKSLSVNAFLNGFRSVLNLLFPLITFPYVSRILSVSGMGIYNFSTTYVNYFVLIAGLGIYTYAVREGAKYRDNRLIFSKFASQIFTINVISTIVAYVLLFLSLMIFKNLSNYISCIIIFSLQLIFSAIGTEWVYTIYEEYSYITIRNIAFKILSIILLFILVKKPEDYLWYATITVFANVGSNVLNFIHAKSFCSIKLVKRTHWHKHLKPILIIFASSIAVTIYVSADTTLLGLLKDDSAVGIYSVSVKIYQMAQGLLSSLLMVTIPRLAMLLGKKRMTEYHDVLSKVIGALGLLVFPTSVGLIMLSKEAVLIIAGERYLDSVNSLRIITWAIIFSIFSWIFSDCVLIPAKRENMVLRNTIITAVVNVLLNLLLIPYMSYDGTSLSTVVAEFMVMVMNGWSSKDIICNTIFSKKNIISITTSILGCIGIVITCLVVKVLITSLIVRTLISIIGSIIIYGVILVLLKNQICLSYLNKIKNKFKDE